MSRICLFVLFLSLFPNFTLVLGSGREMIDLSGKWALKVDMNRDVVLGSGLRHAVVFPLELMLPGSLDESGIGLPSTERSPWKLSRQREYVGPVWIRKIVNIPENWKEKALFLYLERCHWESQLWVDDAHIGMRESLSTPHVYELSGHMAPGRHVLTLRIDNTMKVDVGINAHSITEHTQTNWNGIIGRIELWALDPVHIRSVRTFPDVQAEKVRIEIKVHNTQCRIPAVLRIRAESRNTELTHTTKQQQRRVVLPAGDTLITLDHSMTGALLWEEFQPALYRLQIDLQTPERGYRDTETVAFGMREFGNLSSRFTINGRTTFLRGTLECCVFPLTGYPDMTVEGWSEIFKIAHAYGLNHMRFHSWCPPEAAFEAADLSGFYLQVEGPFWTTVGEGGLLDRYIVEEIDRILDAYGNHPSFCMLAYGNEPGGDHQKEFLKNLVLSWKADSRHLYTSASGWPVIPESDFHSSYEPRIQRWAEEKKSRINRAPLETISDYRELLSGYGKPVVGHEIGQWCAYPDFKEIEKYTGVLRASNFEIAMESLVSGGMADLAEDFLMASGRWQVLQYKEDIEAALRTPGFGGFQLLDLHDFPGQGTALVGVLNTFWEDKGYVDAKGYSRFCGPIVPLMRTEKLTWTRAETFRAFVDIANYGPSDLRNTKVIWKLVSQDGLTIAEGFNGPIDIIQGGPCPAGEIRFDLQVLEAPVRTNLVISLEGTKVENDWPVWIYPDALEIDPGSVTVAHAFAEAEKALESGEKVLWIPEIAALKTEAEGGFSSIFWNTEWTKGQKPHTLGILCNPSHPALAGFPTDSHTNWQWWDPISHGQPVAMDRLGELKPIVRMIDDWNTNRRLGLIFEARVGSGSLLFCSMELEQNIEKRPVSRQLLHSLIRYMNSPAFDPEEMTDMPSLRSLFKSPALMEE